MGAQGNARRITHISLTVRAVSGLRDVPAAAWDALFPADYPFTRHAFLCALETHGCVAPRSGWQPCHLLLEDAQGNLKAAAPRYQKTHSYGEFVFDFAWARASGELGQPYYPKQLCAIPFTPACGPRLGALDDHARAQLLDALHAHWQSSNDSSLHALFLDERTAQDFHRRGALLRYDVQFHWHRATETDFGGFLARLTHDKRKKILRERRRVAEAGIRFESRRGNELSEAQWAQVFALYSNTYEERGQPPYLNLDFFLDYGRASDTPLRLVLGYEGARLIACAILVVGGATLYGRHWGCAEKYHSLHFETCYYQGIEFCLTEGLMHFDAGAQGEHKRTRGFAPVLTRSAHWLVDGHLHEAVSRHLQRERSAIEQYKNELMAHAPFRSPLPAAPASEPNPQQDGA